MATARTSRSAGNLHSVTAERSHQDSALNQPPPPYPGSIDGRDICLRSSLSDLLHAAANANANDNDSSGTGVATTVSSEVLQQSRSQSYPALVNWQLEPSEIEGITNFYTENDDVELQLPRYDAIYGSVDQFSPNYNATGVTASAYQRQQTEPASLDRAVLTNRSRRSRRQQQLSRIGQIQTESGAAVILATHRRESVRLAQMSPIRVSSENLSRGDIGQPRRSVGSLTTNQRSRAWASTNIAHSEGDLTCSQRRTTTGGSRQRLFRFFSGGSIAGNQLSANQSARSQSGSEFIQTVDDTNGTVSPVDDETTGSIVSINERLGNDGAAVSGRTLPHIESSPNFSCHANNLRQSGQYAETENDVFEQEMNPGTPLMTNSPQQQPTGGGSESTVITVDSPARPASTTNESANHTGSNPSDSPQMVLCPFCRATVAPAVVEKSSTVQYVLCCIIAFAGGLLGCCLIPFCFEQLGDLEYYCPNCREEIEKPFITSTSRQNYRSSQRNSSTT